MSTTVVEAKAHLLAAIVAIPSLEHALVHRGLLPEVPTQRERVYLLGTDELRREHAAQPRIFRETYLLPILIEVEKVGKAAGTGQAAHDRAWQIVDELDAAIKADPELGGAVAESALEEIPSEFSLPLEDGWISKIVARIRVEAFTT